MKLITIANPGSLIEAEQLRARLAASGIQSFIPDKFSAGVAPHFFMAKSGVRLQVEAEDEVEARKMIEEFHHPPEDLA